MIECEEYSKNEGGRRTYIQKSCYIPLCATFPQQHPTHVHGDIILVTGETNWQTGVVQWVDDWSAVSLWRHQRDLMCSRLKVEVGFLGNLQGPGMAGDHAAKWRKKGQLEEEKSHYSSPEEYPAGHRQVFQASGSGSDFGWGLEFSECPSSPPSFCLGQSGGKFSSLLFILLHWWLLLFFTCFTLVLGLICLFQFSFIVGFLDCC